MDGENVLTEVTMRTLGMERASRYGELLGIHAGVMSKRLAGKSGPGKNGVLVCKLINSIVPDVARRDEVIEALAEVPKSNRNEATSAFVLQMLAIRKGRADLVNAALGCAVPEINSQELKKLALVNSEEIGMQPREESVMHALQNFRQIRETLKNWIVSAPDESKEYYLQAFEHASAFIDRMELAAAFERNQGKSE